MSASAPSGLPAETEASRIGDQLHRAYKGPAWHGPPLKAILLDVSERQAFVRPPNGVHSIAEIALHIGAWMRIARERLSATEARDVSEEENWPAATIPWREVVMGVEAEERALRDAILKFPDERLNDKAPALEPQTYYTLLHGVVQHTLYHAGQIAILNK